jgi:hypothetical protein
MTNRIDILLNDIRPDSCLDVGLDCRTCLHRTAADLAAICLSLEGGSLWTTFAQIYPHPSCGPMFSNFEHAYLEALDRETERTFAATAA